MLFYCPNCKKEHDAEPKETITTKSNRVAYKANCPVCGQDMAEFIPEKKQQLIINSKEEHMTDPQTNDSPAEPVDQASSAVAPTGDVSTDANATTPTIEAARPEPTGVNMPTDPVDDASTTAGTDDAQTALNQAAKNLADNPPPPLSNTSGDEAEVGASAAKPKVKDPVTVEEVIPAAGTAPSEDSEEMADTQPKTE